MESVSFRVHGLPAPKGSVTKMGTGAYLPAGTAASRMNFMLWKDNIVTAARYAMEGVVPWPGPVRLFAEFQLPVPRSMPTSRRGWYPHVKRPDWDKLTRALADPLTGIVWVDDSQVCHSTLNKVYAWDDKPGVIVIVDFLTNEWCRTYAAQHRKVTNLLDQVEADEFM